MGKWNETISFKMGTKCLPEKSFDNYEKNFLTLTSAVGENTQRTPFKDSVLLLYSHQQKQEKQSCKRAAIANLRQAVWVPHITTTFL